MLEDLQSFAGANKRAHGKDVAKHLRSKASEARSRLTHEAGRPDVESRKQQELRELRERDREVRSEEHRSLNGVGDAANGTPHYTFVRGPDGRQYAVEGETPLDTTREATPEQTLRKARQIRAAALGSREPSLSDQALAAKATQLELQAEHELARKQRQETGIGTPPEPAATEPVQTPGEKPPAVAGGGNAQAHSGPAGGDAAGEAQKSADSSLTARAEEADAAPGLRRGGREGQLRQAFIPPAAAHQPGRLLNTAA